MEIANKPEISGLYFEITILLSSPDQPGYEGNHPVFSYKNSNITFPELGETPTPCGGIEGGALWANTYLNQPGLYFATWIFQWSPAVSVNTTGSVPVCTGSHFPEMSAIFRNFTVTAAGIEATSTASESSLQSATSLLTAWTSAQFTPRPTINIYTLDSAAPRSLDAGGLAWAGIWTGIMFGLGLLLHVA